MSRLGWGHRHLLCPPQHFGVLYEINPWMRSEVKAGGGCRCLTLALDVELSARPSG